jgi:hypothetical protein
LNGIYRHYKGPLYVVLGLAQDSTNGPSEGLKMVLYYSLGKHKLCVREISQFTEKVPWPDGSMRPRFELLGDA